MRGSEPSVSSEEVPVSPTEEVPISLTEESASLCSESLNVSASDSAKKSDATSFTSSYSKLTHNLDEYDEYDGNQATEFIDLRKL